MKGNKWREPGIPDWDELEAEEIPSGEEAEHRDGYWTMCGGYGAQWVFVPPQPLTEGEELALQFLGMTPVEVTIHCSIIGIDPSPEFLQFDPSSRQATIHYCDQIITVN